MRKLATLSFTVALATVVACGGTKKDAADPDQDPVEFEDPPDKPVDPTKPVLETHLTLAEVTLKLQGGTELTISAEGRIENGGNHVGDIKPTGQFLAENGGLYGTLKADGTMLKAFVNLDRFAGIHISANGVLTKKSDTGEMVELNEISETGEVSENGVVGLTIEGPPEGRQAAMFVYLVLLGSSLDAQEKANPTPAPAPAPTPNG